MGEIVANRNQMPYQVLNPNFDTNIIKKANIDLSPIGKKDKLAFILNNVFTVEECDSLIKVSEQTGYGPAYVNAGERQILAPGYRDGSRVLIDDKEFVKILFNRISKFLPQTFQGTTLIEINERLRFLRYSNPGERFAPHSDASYARPDGSAATQITLQMYLNEGFDGGETTFLEKNWKNDKIVSRVPVVPKTGMILVFEHNILHEGSVMKAGQKYTIRTDVLYTF